MNPDFRWTIPQAADVNSKELYASLRFTSPHDGIWQDDNRTFSSVRADKVYGHLSKDYQSLFLTVCLASYLLNPKKAPLEFRAWFLSKTSVCGLMGLDLSWEEITSLSWERVALPGVDLSGGCGSKVVYALVSCLPGVGGHNLLFPKPASSFMDKQAQDSVLNAASLASNEHPRAMYIFWPLLNSAISQSIRGNSLGLPLYLSFLSVARNKPVPNIVATGGLNHEGKVLEVGGIKEKYELASDKKFDAFIYPDATPFNANESIPAEGVKSLEEATDIWFGNKIPLLLKILMPLPFHDDLTRHTSKFVGRQWIIEKIEAWLDDPSGGNVYWLTGAPGVGKTAISAWLCENSSQRVVAWHFCDFNSEEKKNPVKFVRSIAFQLATKFPKYAQQLLTIGDMQRLLTATILLRCLKD